MGNYKSLVDHSEPGVVARFIGLGVVARFIGLDVAGSRGQGYFGFEIRFAFVVSLDIILPALFLWIIFLSAILSI